MLALTWLTVVVLAALLADVLPLPSYDRPVAPPRIRPFQQWNVPLGTDRLGRDMLSRVVYGARASLGISLLAVIIGLVIGGFLGLVAGYSRGVVDRATRVLADSVLAIPALVFLLTLAALLTASMKTLVIGLAIVSIPAMIRISRATTLSYAQADFVTIARALGAKKRRILFRELLPNILIPLLAYTFIVIAVLIVAEGSLSFLGLGIPPPTPSWGGMIADGRQDMDTDLYLVLVPSVIMFLTVYALNVVGDWARNRVDNRSSAL
ncbi:MAG: ABC transporter permease [Ilumatobacteraceae bacterium]